MSKTDNDDPLVEPVPEQKRPSDEIPNSSSIASQNQSETIPEQSDICIKLGDENELQSNETQELNSAYTEENTENEATTQKVTNQAELSGEERAVNQLLEALNTSNFEPPETDNEQKIDVNIDLDSSIDQTVTNLDDEDIDNDFGKGIPAGMISVLDALDPICNAESENKLEKESKVEMESKDSIATNKNIIDDSDKIECDESILIKPDNTSEDKEENNSNPSEISTDEKIFNHTINIEDQIEKPAENTQDNSDEITLEDILQAKKPKIEDEVNFRLKNKL